MPETVEQTAPLTEQWTGRKYNFPKNRYIARIADKTFKTSSKGNPMIEIGWEIVAKGDGTQALKVKGYDGKDYTVAIAGAQSRTYLTLSESAKKMVQEFCKKMKLPVTELDPSAPDLSLLDGIIANVIVVGEKSQELSDELDEVTGKQKPILDDDGKPIVKTYLRITDIISRNTTFQPSNPY